MLDTYVTRQPIFDANLRVYAYELFFSVSAKANLFTGDDKNCRSLITAIESFRSIGLDTVTSRKPAFVNFSSTLLLENIAALFSKDLLVVELIKTIEPTREIVDACCDLRSKGYVLAMDDFIYHPKLEPLAEHCRIIKIDFLNNSPEQISAMIQEMAMDFDLNGKLFLADKLETREMFSRAVGMGFKFFQGHFFLKPFKTAPRYLKPATMNYLSLISKINDAIDTDSGRAIDIIHSDITLCQNLLKLANSPYYGPNSCLEDVDQALNRIGIKEVRKWVYFMALVEFCANKTEELIKTSLIRAFFMEEMTSCCKLHHSGEMVFLFGLFSLIDVILQMPMPDAINGLNLPVEINEALTARNGKLYNLLLLIIGIEKASWHEIDLLTTLFGISTGQVSGTYLNAVKHCDDMLNSFN